MIGSFRDRRLKRYYARGDTRLLPANMLDRIRSILARLDIADSIDPAVAQLQPAPAERRPEGLLEYYGQGQLADYFPFPGWKSP